MNYEYFFTHMDYIYTVYLERSFTKAAEKLFISQPSLSFTIKKVENEIGYPLFERSGKSISPTPVGARCIRFIEDVMRLEGRLGVEIEEILKHKNGKLSIGSTEFVAKSMLPDILKRFKEKYPDVEISVVAEGSGELEMKLENDEVDIIIDNATVFIDGYKYVPLLNEQLLLGVPRGLPINGELKDKQLAPERIKAEDFSVDPSLRIGLDAFRAQRFILLKRGSKLRQLAGRIFDEARIIPNLSMEFNHISAAISYAVAGFGLCFVTDAAVKFGEADGKLCYYAINTLFSEMTLYLIHKKNKQLSNTAKAFIEYIRGREGLGNKTEINENQIENQ